MQRGRRARAPQALVACQSQLVAIEAGRDPTLHHIPGLIAAWLPPAREFGGRQAVPFQRIVEAPEAERVDVEEHRSQAPIPAG